MPSLYAVVVVSLFMAVGPGLMVVNKEILSTVHPSPRSLPRTDLARAL